MCDDHVMLRGPIGATDSAAPGSKLEPNGRTNQVGHGTSRGATTPRARAAVPERGNENRKLNREDRVSTLELSADGTRQSRHTTNERRNSRQDM